MPQARDPQLRNCDQALRRKLWHLMVMDLTSRIVWHLEMSLNAQIGLAELADRCGASKFHMLRAFALAVGLSPMAYLRARRLTEAAKRLAGGCDDILNVALDAQYGSHAAFTRAFAAHFGVLPSRIRTPTDILKLTLTEAYLMEKPQLVPLDPPRICDHPAFRVVGMGIDCTFEDIAGIPALWQSFNQRIGEIEEDGIVAAFGVCCDADAEGRFRYVAGVASPNATVPEGMESQNIPAGKYAVFTHKGHIGDFPKTVYSVWNKGIPDAELTPTDAPNFELYDKRFNPVTGRGEVEIWIPIS